MREIFQITTHTYVINRRNRITQAHREAYYKQDSDFLSAQFIFGKRQLLVILSDERQIGGSLDPADRGQRFFVVDHHDFEILHVVRGRGPARRFQDFFHILFGNRPLGIEKPSV